MGQARVKSNFNLYLILSSWEWQRWDWRLGCKLEQMKVLNFNMTYMSRHCIEFRCWDWIWILWARTDNSVWPWCQSRWRTSADLLRTYIYIYIYAIQVKCVVLSDRPAYLYTVSPQSHARIRINFISWGGLECRLLTLSANSHSLSVRVL